MKNLFWHRSSYLWTLSLLFILPTISCRNHSDNGSKQVVVEMGKHVLLKRDMAKLGIDTSDVRAIRNYVNTWVSDRLFADQAGQMLSDEALNSVQQLVANYRQMLLRNAYERYLMVHEVDTLIVAKDLQNYYMKNKDKLTLEHSILRYRHVEVPKGKHAPGSMLQLMKSHYPKDIETLRDWCRLNNANCMLDDTIWRRWAKVKKFLPPGILLNKSDIGKSVRIKHKGQVHYFYLSDYKTTGEIPPLSYFRDNLRKSILFQRKRELIERKRKELYNKAIQQGKLHVLLSSE